MALVPKLFQKKWFLALFIAIIILLIVETSLIIFFVVASSLGRQAFPSLDLSLHLKPLCSTLTGAMVTSTPNNRTIEYSCAGREALYMPQSGFSTPADCCGADSILVSPGFSLPRGYLSLSLVRTEIGCRGQPQIQLQNGQNVTLGGPSSNGDGVTYDYCAVISEGSGPVEGFLIVWNKVPWPGLCCTITASPSRLTIPAGQNASSTVTVTALGSFFGNVSFGGVGESGSLAYPPTSPTWRFSPPTVIVKPEGSNSTTVTVQIPKDSVPQTLALIVYIYPNRYYNGGTITISVKVP